MIVCLTLKLKDRNNIKLSVNFEKLMAEVILNLVKLEILVTVIDAQRYLRVTLFFVGVYEVLCLARDGN